MSFAPEIDEDDDESDYDDSENEFDVEPTQPKKIVEDKKDKKEEEDDDDDDDDDEHSNTEAGLGPVHEYGWGDTTFGNSTKYRPNCFVIFGRIVRAAYSILGEASQTGTILCASTSSMVT
jgi:hypothetical protein